MEYYKKIACVTVEDLTGGSDPVMTKTNYNNYVARRKFNVVRPGKGSGCYALIEYSSMPEKVKERFVQIHGDIHQLLKNSMTIDLVIDYKAREFFDEFRFSNCQSLPIEVQREYTINCSVLKFLQNIINERKSLRKALGGDTKKIWETVIGVADSLRANPGHTLPECSARLQDSLRKFRSIGYASVISGKYGNQNTVKIDDAAAELIIALKRSRVPVYTNAQIFEEFNRRAPQLGLKTLKSLQAISLFLKRSDVMPLWYDAVHGELAAKLKFTRKNKTILPQMRDALWYSDGTKINLYYKAYEKDRKGHTRMVVKTTSVYEVMDSYSEMLLGYYISDSENYEAQYNAFRMAIQRSECRPYEIVNDNQGGHKKLEASDFFKRIARVSRRTAPYNGASKTIESVFGRFQKQVLHKNWFFTGQNITTVTLESRPNIEFIEANKESLPTLDQLKVIYSECRKEWNNMPHPATGISRLEMYNKSVNPETEKVTMLDMIDMFWLTTKTESTYTSSGIQIVINHRKYVYEILDAFGKPDLKFVHEKSIMYKKFFVMYDPEDMTIVRLYEKTSTGLRYVASAQPYVEMHRAIQEQKEGEMKLYRELDNTNKQLRIERREKANEIEDRQGVNPEYYGLRRPGMKGLSKKDYESTDKKKVEAPEDEVLNLGSYEKAKSNMDYLLSKI